jgi:hypothetical protein
MAMAQPANSALKRANGAADNNQSGAKVGATTQACPVFDVIILVAGTVDPVNSDMNKLANSYDRAAHDPRFRKESGKDSDYYWDGNEDFINPVVAFQKTYDHVHFFGDHSWSGDNCIHNRELAGSILGDWLCGNGMKPALPAYLNRKVSFHFIGHSHGGNVTNEVTRQIARIRKWPGDWKVKSVTYLSTPFFQKIHKPNTAKFHGKAKICNVWCNYDLTQTAIADFSLRQLTRVTDVVVSAQKTLKPAIDRIVQFDANCLWALVTPPSTKVKWDWLNTKVETTWNMDPTEGRNLYTRVLAVIKDIKLIFSEVKNMILALNQFVPTRISEPLQKKGLVEKRKIISDGVRDKIIKELDAVLAGVTPTESAFTRRVASGVYPVKGFVSDVRVEALVLPLIALLDVNSGSLNGKLTSLLFEAFEKQIEVFDDTLATCNHLYSIPIVPVDVTSKDNYSRKGKDPQFYRFKGLLIKAEQAYMGNPTQYNFLHMLFLLAAQLEDLHNILVKAENTTNMIVKVLDKWKWFDDSSSFYLRMRDLVRVARSWFAIFNSRYCGGIESDTPVRTPKCGSVPYLAMVSHSVSRMKLYPEVDKFLRGQFDSHPVPPKR